jgi:hypothetical protein
MKGAADGRASPSHLAHDRDRRRNGEFLPWPLGVLADCGTTLTEAALFVMLMSVTLAMVLR